MITQLDAEQQRLKTSEHSENWRLWGPYLAERAWGTVREDYSPDGNAWEYFDHDQSRSRAYRWNEDGLGRYLVMMRNGSVLDWRYGTAGMPFSRSALSV